MRYKITRKLILFITIILLSFSIVTGFLFSFLFNRYTVDFHKADMERRALVIAETLSTYLEAGGTTPSGMMGHGNMGLAENMHGFRPYLNVIDKIAMSDVWVVDENAELIVRAQGANLNLSELPAAGETVINEALLGNISFSESFSDVLGSKYLTIGAPVKNSAGVIIAAVLLHAPVNSIESSTMAGFQILSVSTLIALALAIGLAIILSMKFIRPLNDINSTATKLAEGDYSVKTGVILNDEIGELARTIDVLSERLLMASKESDRMEKTRRDFISSISHELRTPVTVLRGSLEALRDKVVVDPIQVNEYHGQMLKECLSLQRLVDDLLSLTKLQNPDFKMDMVPLNLSEVLSDVVRSMKTLAEKKNIVLKCDNPYETLKIRGDYGRLRQMIMVIIDNAIKFSPPNETVILSMKCQDSHCKLSIEDHGSGIAKDDIPYIFDRFNRVNAEENHQGTGLGLAIAKEIASRHHIGLSVHSEPDMMTLFTFDFTKES